MLGLTEFLGDHRHRSLRIEKSVANNLADDLLGAPVLGFGTASLAFESGRAALLQSAAKLEIAWFGKAELARGGQGAQFGAFAFVDHRQFEGDLIVAGDLQFAGGTVQEVFFLFNSQHRQWRVFM